ncbi:MAG: hypothetical protein AAFY50_24850 [Cyanobacteria bacterium J06648_1]
MKILPNAARSADRRLATTGKALALRSRAWAVSDRTLAIRKVKKSGGDKDRDKFSSGDRHQ